MHDVKRMMSSICNKTLAGKCFFGLAGWTKVRVRIRGQAEVNSHIKVKGQPEVRGQCDVTVRWRSLSRPAAGHIGKTIG